jgi:interleukin enhancer-binding factor 2
MKPPKEDAPPNPFQDALDKKNEDLTPNEKEQTALSNLVTKVQTVLDDLIVSPVLEDLVVEEVRQVEPTRREPW